MNASLQVIPIECKFGPTSAYAYYIDAPEPAIIDTGIASSVATEIDEVLTEKGIDMTEIKWIILTHGHVDHLGGAYAMWEKTGRRAKVVIPKKEAYLLRDREQHLIDYDKLQARFVDEKTQERHRAILLHDIGESIEPTLEVVDGDKIHLGGDITLRVIETPGHSMGSVSYMTQNENWVFAADAVQMYGGAKSGLPAIEFPALYRESIQRLQQEMPKKLFLGHYFKGKDDRVYDAIISEEDIEDVLQASLAMDEKLTKLIANTEQTTISTEESMYGEYAALAEALDYTANPTNLPCAFFVTMQAYKEELTVRMK